MLEPRYSLAEAADRYFKGGRVNRKSLARAVRMGLLKAEFVSGQYWVTEAAIAAFLAASVVKPKPKPGVDVRPDETERKRRAQLQAQMTLDELRKK